MNRSSFVFAALLAAGGIIAAATAPASTATAATIVGLMDGRSLVSFDSETGKVAKPVKLVGVGKLVGIDMRPADGKLYGVTGDGMVVTIDPMTGKATQVVVLKTMLQPNTVATIDFNPVADRLRLIGNDGSNLRANLADGAVTTDGTLTYAETDMHKGEKPNIIAGAYTNSVAGAKETTLFDIDGTIGALVKQAPPNDGKLNAVGKLGPKPKKVAFDIATSADGTNWAFLVAGGKLHMVDLATGKADAGKAIKGLPAVSDIAVMK